MERIQDVVKRMGTSITTPRVDAPEELRTRTPTPTAQYMRSAGPAYMSDDVQNRLNQAVDNEMEAKRQRKERRQAQKANRRLEKSRKKLAREAAKNAARATGYDGITLMFNKKGEPVRVPVVFDDMARPVPAAPYERVAKTFWAFPDCTVEMIPWMGSLKAFRVRMGNRIQTVVPYSLRDMQGRVMELNANISPVDYWYDGEGVLVCPRNGVPKDGPAKKPAKKPASKAPAKTAPAKKPQKASVGKSKASASAQRKPAKKPSAKTSGSQNRKTTPAKRNPTAKRRC